MPASTKTKRLLVVHEAVAVGGFGAEIVATVAERLGADAAVRRLGAPRIPIGYAPSLEDVARVSETTIVGAALAMVRGGKRGKAEP